MPIGLPIKCGAGSADDPVVEGSIRQRSAGSFELRVFIGIDPETHRRRYRSMTVRANRPEAERELAVMGRRGPRRTPGRGALDRRRTP